MDINIEQVVFENIVDPGELKDLIENFSVISGLTTVLVDNTTNEALLNTGRHDICVKFHRTCQGSPNHCVAGNKDLTTGLSHSGEIRIHHCKNGKEIPTGTERILVVDDEITIVSLQKTVLERLGYKVTATVDSREAFEKIRSDLDRFDLIITDQSMPYLSGVELAEEILKIKSDLKIILCTGHSSVITEEGALAIGIKKYLKKPVNRSTLANIVRQVLDGD